MCPNSLFLAWPVFRLVLAKPSQDSVEKEPLLGKGRWIFQLCLLVYLFTNSKVMCGLKCLLSLPQLYVVSTLQCTLEEGTL